MIKSALIEGAAPMPEDEYILEKLGGLGAKVAGLQDQQNRDRDAVQTRIDKLETNIAAGFRQSQTDREAQGETIGQMILQNRLDIKADIKILSDAVMALTTNETKRNVMSKWAGKIASGLFVIFITILGGITASFFGLFGHRGPPL